MASLNKVMLIGNLGRDPEVRYLPSGEAVANFSIATTETWKDKAGQRQEKTEWHRIVLYRRLAEIAGEYLKKGSQVYIEGRIETKKWQDKDGQERQNIEIVGSEMKMLTGAGQKPDGGDAPMVSPEDRAARAVAKARAVEQGAAGIDNMDDDIPF